MVDGELFVHLAEIAGVFVGFGALIAVRSEEASDAHTVEYLRGVVEGGLLVVVAALAPLVVSRFGMEGRACGCRAAASSSLSFWSSGLSTPDPPRTDSTGRSTGYSPSGMRPSPSR